MMAPSYHFYEVMAAHPFGLSSRTERVRDLRTKLKAELRVPRPVGQTTLC